MPRPNASPIILWDLMDTLVRDPFYTHVADFFGLSFDDLIAAKHPTIWRDFELGRVDEQTVYEVFFRDGTPIDGPGLKRCMGDNTVWIDGMEELLAELSAAGHSMHLLSNYAPWYRLCFDRLGLGRFVEPTFVSCHTGVRKPDPESYLGPCRTLGVAPGDCLFVDDRLRNCEAARAVGMPAFRFEGDAGQLRTELASLGLLG